MDGNFRITLPAELREFASLKKNVFLVGQGNKFELWDEEKWQEGQEEWLEEEANSAEGESVLDQIII